MGLSASEALLQEVMVAQRQFVMQMPWHDKITDLSLGNVGSSEGPRGSNHDEADLCQPDTGGHSHGEGLGWFGTGPALLCPLPAQSTQGWQV